MIGRARRRGAFVAGLLVLPLAAACRVPRPGAPSGEIADPPIVSADNPTTPAKVELGRRLFYDADLSINGTMSCATCHGQRGAFTDRATTHPGALGHPGRRNVPTLTNVAWAGKLTCCDPRVTTLEEQAVTPITGTDPIEMGMGGQEHLIAERLGVDACYRRMFAEAFPEDSGRIDLGTVAKALASFQRTMISFGSPWDRFIRGDSGAIPVEARRGAAFFAGPGGCTRCHAGANLSDGRYHALEPDSAARRDDRGLAEATGSPADVGRFRTPTLRNVAVTSPYLHDGSARTLEAAIRRHRAAVPAAGRFTEADEASLVAFLAQLTDSAFIADPKFTIPRTACGVPR